MVRLSVFINPSPIRRGGLSRIDAMKALARQGKPFGSITDRDHRPRYSMVLLNQPLQSDALRPSLAAWETFLRARILGHSSSSFQY